MNKVYISGAVTTDPNFRSKFDHVEELLKGHGYDVVNPVKDEADGKEWSYYLKKDIKKLVDCDTIYILSDWIYSKGARLEINIALELGMKVILEGEL